MSEMCDISNVEVKQEVTEDDTNNQEIFILPDRYISDTTVKQEDMELADGEERHKETDDVDYKLQPSCSKTSTQILVDDEGESAHICDICDKSFARNQNLKLHMETVHQGKRFECDYCEKKFASKSGLKDHVLTLHEAHRALKCPICDIV